MSSDSWIQCTLVRESCAPAASRRGQSVPPRHTRAPSVALAALASGSLWRRRLRLALTSWSIAGALFAVAPCLRAQEPTPSVAALKKEDAPVGAVRVFVSTNEDGLLLTVAQPGRQQGIVSCYHQCSFWGLPGGYSLWATSCKPEVHYQTTVYVGRHTVFKVSSGHRGLRTAGLIAGIAGPIVALSGLVLGLSRLSECHESNCPPQKDNTVAFALFVGGLVVTPAGWMIFATSGPSVDDEPNELIKSDRGPHLRMGVLVLPRGGWGMGLSTLF
jgi:hypothetical protein